MSITGTASSDESSIPEGSTVIQITNDHETMSLHPFPLHADSSHGSDKLSVDRPLFDASAHALRVM